MSETNDDKNRSNTHTDSERIDRSVDEETVVRSSDPSFPSSVPQAVQLPEEFGRYRIVRTLGAGGMGSVFLAEDTQLQRLVAVKVPHFTRDGKPGVIERFYREARAMATLNHANLCSVFDVGEIDGLHYLTMAYIEGEDLSEILKDAERANDLNIVELVRKLAAALSQAHEAGVIHRDLKPSNMIIDRRGEPVVMDFGLARREDQGDPQLTREGAIVGTPSYMSPEQVEGDPDTVGPTSDIYSLGVIFYQLLCGKMPFSGNVAVILTKILSAQFDHPSKVRNDIDPALEVICLRAMARQPADRYKSMQELVGALDEYRGGHSIVSQQLRKKRRSAQQALLPGFQHDLIVSYLSADDEPPPGQTDGWVTTLVDNLVWRMRQLGGFDQDLSVWLDHNIKQTPSSEWTNRLGGTAMMLLVVSPGFTSAVNDLYLQRIKDRYPAGGESLFVIERDRIESAVRSDALESIRSVSFWEDDGNGPRVLGHPRVRPELDTSYYAKIDDLSRLIHARMKDIQSESGSSLDVSSGSQIAVAADVFLAESTDDLDSARTELERYLDQFGLGVRPSTWYPRDERDFRQQVSADLEQSVVFVQLLSELAGKRPPQGERTYVQIQWDLAKQAGLPILQWRSSQLDVNAIRDESHRQLADNDEIQAVELEQFKRAVVQSALREKERRTEQPEDDETADGVFVFVNVERDDSALADDLCALLDESGCSYATPIYEGRPDEIRRDLEANLLECDGLIVVYGGIAEQWVREQLRQWRKILFRRDKPLIALAIYEGPPAEKGRLGMRLPKMKTIDCRDGLQEDRVREFIATLLRQE